MNKKVGLWISRAKAVIVSTDNNIEARRIITSDMANYVLYSTVVPGDGTMSLAGATANSAGHVSEVAESLMARIIGLRLAVGAETALRLRSGFRASLGRAGDPALGRGHAHAARRPGTHH